MCYTDWAQCEEDINEEFRISYQEGYEQAEKDIDIKDAISFTISYCQRFGKNVTTDEIYNDYKEHE